MTNLPIHDALEPLITALKGRGRAVLQAPPGAGKTTVVPLEILSRVISSGKVLVLEPRRLAAQSAAKRMAQTLGDRVGDTVGYRVRGDTRVSTRTRIEVITEGILTRMIQDDPELSGISAVIFDEFHERSLHADLGLALCLEVAEVLREDLILLAMSATLDAEPVAALMGDVPIITSEGRAFPVYTHWLDAPLGKKDRLENTTALLIERAVAEASGGVLVFLPGESEIRRTQSLLNLPNDCYVYPLYGAMPFKAQQAAIKPVSKGRKIVLATAIAETSLTIEDVRIVVDSGRARRSRFDPGSGMSRLVTERVSRAEATQRRGRAGRVAEGRCYRLWSREEEGSLPPFPPAEIEATDLTKLALDLALWGAKPSDLAFLTQPNPGAFAEAKAILQMLKALDDRERISDHGRAMAKLPMHPRLAHMLISAGETATNMAALLSDRDPLSRGSPVDFTLRLEAVSDLKQFLNRRPWQVNRSVLKNIHNEATRLRKVLDRSARTILSAAEMAALAYPDRIGLRRKGVASRFVMSGGKGGVMDDGDPLSGARLIVVTDTDGNPREARIRQAIQISEAEIRNLFQSQITLTPSCAWSKRERRVIARNCEMLGAIALSDKIWKNPPESIVGKAMLDGVRDLGFNMNSAVRRFITRVSLVRDAGYSLPNMCESVLLDHLEVWLLPHLNGIKTADQWKKFDLLEPLHAMLDWSQMQLLDREAPGSFTSPLGRKIAIDYANDHPSIELRLQEMFGQKIHPKIGKSALRVTLLSPAGRPVQTTMDLPGFWANSYADVRKEMRGRYPKHPWPEDPTEAHPTLRTKRRSR